MSDKDWADAWNNNQIGFHQSQTNAYLAAHGKAVWGDTPSRVLVPLCGKSLDMVYLAQTAEHVVGVEFVDKAVQDFFTEQGLDAEVTSEPLQRYDAGNYTLFAADFFNITPEHTGKIDAVFDRASMVALDADTRTRYAKHMTELLQPGTKMLLVTFEYDQNTMAGPPFAILPDEVEQHYGDAFSIEILERRDFNNDMMRSRGASTFDATAYSLIRQQI